MEAKYITKEVRQDEITFSVSEDVGWTPEVLRELRLMHDVYFMSGGYGCFAVMIVDGQFYIGIEDDGVITFKKNVGGDVTWIPYLISDLAAAIGEYNLSHLE